MLTFFDSRPEAIANNHISYYSPLVIMLISLLKNEKICKHLKQRDFKRELWYRAGKGYGIDSIENDKVFFFLEMSNIEVYHSKETGNVGPFPGGGPDLFQPVAWSYFIHGKS
ncbi:hypothetical protein DASC09_064010 [Saccharomycopsis crataegensis]|uniref:Uncharacterized protein n=1 Tax=Saccharomycopsis crataegensis TaxID=43959 RepID=A0AAV5QWX1_9ASCO|nr:hypothetical protein DASC09_064010 [Saccharomycopsis crataegensis]